MLTLVLVSGFGLRLLFVQNHGRESSFHEKHLEGICFSFCVSTKNVFWKLTAFHLHLSHLRFPASKQQLRDTSWVNTGLLRRCPHSNFFCWTVDNAYRVSSWCRLVLNPHLTRREHYWSQLCCRLHNFLRQKNFGKLFDLQTNFLLQGVCSFLLPIRPDLFSFYWNLFLYKHLQQSLLLVNYWLDWKVLVFCWCWIAT